MLLKEHCAASSALRAKLDQRFASARESRERRALRKSSATRIAEPGSMESGLVRSEFDIPLGGRSAVLVLPLPTAEIDVNRIKGWIDLMSDVLTEAPVGRY
ncbi:MAG: hypothetical protein H7Z14_01330 [Anaerolineae bacterium]|nr:hypothetical protein [Phycisphaerae bacterium]